MTLYHKYQVVECICQTYPRIEIPNINKNHIIIQMNADWYHKPLYCINNYLDNSRGTKHSRIIIVCSNLHVGVASFRVRKQMS
jgi:hypothetical protein